MNPHRNQWTRPTSPDELRYLAAFDAMLRRGWRGNPRLASALDALALIVNHPRYARIEAATAAKAETGGNTLTAQTDAKLTAEIAKTLQNASTTLSALNHVTGDPKVGFDLAACCAMVQNESGGRMVWGHDPWDSGMYPKGLALPVALEGATVSQHDYTAYKARRNGGMQPQGCGITQLTSAGLQVDAERAGGCWVPFYNCLIGFRFLKGLFVAHGSALAGFTAYNGSGPAAQAYGERAVELQAGWQQRLNAALKT
jgi:hypothetical protein